MTVDVLTARPFVILEVESPFYDLTFSLTRQQRVKPVLIICPHLVDWDLIAVKPLRPHLFRFHRTTFKYFNREHMYFKRLRLSIVIVYHCANMIKI
jgi:hypothetical protein